MLTLRQIILILSKTKFEKRVTLMNLLRNYSLNFALKSYYNFYSITSECFSSLKSIVYV